jgi:signal transduction histidine kinase
VVDELVAAGISPAPALVMVTGQGDERVAVDAMKRGVHDYLVKGLVTGESLERAVRSAMEKVALRLELEAKQRALLASNRELERFACTVAHDLQAPLTNLTLCLSRLGELQAGSPDTGAQRMLRRGLEQTDRLRLLIRELLEFSRLDGPRQPFGAVDCAALMAEVLSTLSALIAEHGAQVQCGALPAVQGHRVQLLQVFQNLVANAIVYRRDAPPVVDVGARREREEWVFSVRDNGVGIEPELQQAVFEPLRRLHGYHEVPGSGLGLAICKKVVEYHGGRIWVESQPNAGSVFSFTLPA